MILSNDAYREEIKDYDNEELMNEKDALERFLFKYENDLLPRFLHNSFPSVDLLYEVRKCYLAELKKELKRREIQL